MVNNETGKAMIGFGSLGIALGLPPDSPQRFLCFITGSALIVFPVAWDVQQMFHTRRTKRRVMARKRAERRKRKVMDRLKRYASRSLPDPLPESWSNSMPETASESVPPKGKTTFTPDELVQYFGDQEIRIGSTKLGTTKDLQENRDD